MSREWIRWKEQVGALTDIDFFDRGGPAKGNVPVGWNYWELATEEWPAAWNPLPPIYVLWHQLPFSVACLLDRRFYADNLAIPLGVTLLLPVCHPHWRWPAPERRPHWFPRPVKDQGTVFSWCNGHPYPSRMEATFRLLPEFREHWHSWAIRFQDPALQLPHDIYLYWGYLCVADQRQRIIESIQQGVTQFAESCRPLQQELLRQLLQDQTQFAEVQERLQGSCPEQPLSSSEQPARRLRRHI
jgi:hypothetical protein